MHQLPGTSVGDARVSRVERAAAALARRRTLLATAWARSEGDDRGRVVAVGEENFHGWLFARSSDWRHLWSTRHSGPRPTPELVSSLRNNRRLVDGGLVMTSVFAADHCKPDLVDVLAGQGFDYRVAHAPLDMKVVDRHEVMLEGPEVDGQRSILVADDAVTVGLAHRYWRALSAGSHAARDLVGMRAVLHGSTGRQRAVLGLLAREASDEQAAEVLGTSVRTVRSEMAAAKRLLVVSTRFAAGVELGRLLRTLDDTPSPA